MEILISIAGQVVGWKSRVSNFRDGRFNGNGSWSKVSFVGKWNIKFVRGQVTGRKGCSDLQRNSKNEDEWNFEAMRLLGIVPSWISWIFDSFQVMRQKYNVMLSLIQRLIIIENFRYSK